MKIRKRSIEVEAILWDGNLESAKVFCGDNATTIGDELYVWNIEENQWFLTPVGHYIIKGVNGEYYPCSKDVFDKTYDVVE